MHRNVVLPSRRRGRVRRRRRRRHSLRHHHRNRFIVVECLFMCIKNTKRVVKRSLSFYLQFVMEQFCSNRAESAPAAFQITEGLSECLFVLVCTMNAGMSFRKINLQILSFAPPPRDRVPATKTGPTEKKISREENPKKENREQSKKKTREKKKVPHRYGRTKRSLLPNILERANFLTRNYIVTLIRS